MSGELKVTVNFSRHVSVDELKSAVKEVAKANDAELYECGEVFGQRSFHREDSISIAPIRKAAKSRNGKKFYARVDVMYCEWPADPQFDDFAACGEPTEDQLIFALIRFAEDLEANITGRVASAKRVRGQEVVACASCGCILRAAKIQNNVSCPDHPGALTRTVWVQLVEAPN